MQNIVHSTEARAIIEEIEARLHRWMEATRDPFEYSKRGPLDYLDVGQQWANKERYKGVSTY